MNLTGFDPQLVNNSIGSEQSAFERLVAALKDDMQSQFVGGMAQKWACNDAIQFFTNNFKPAIDDIIVSSNNVFRSVVETMGQAGQAWASDTQTSYSPTAFSDRNVQIDVSDIRENIGDVRGIDLQEAVNTASSALQSVAGKVDEALSAARTGVDNCGFVGGEQAANLQNSLNGIRDSFNKAYADIQAALNKAIENTVAAYGDTKGKIEQSFTATQA